MIGLVAIFVVQFLVILLQSKIEGESSLYVWSSFLITLASITLFTALFFWYLKRLLYPMRCLVNFCENFSDDPESLPSCSGSLEVEELKDAIITLLEEKKALCSQERDIFKEAAHELKMPVSILKSRVALFNKKESYDKAKFIKEANSDIDQIALRLQELLFLKSIEMDMHGKVSEVDLVSQCDDLQQAFRVLVEKKELNIVPVRRGSFSIITSEKALQRVLLAIFENIFIHTKPKSTITVTIDGDKRILEVENEVALENDDKLFSSQIGTKIIERLSGVLNYTYRSEEREGTFITQIHFHDKSRVVQ